MFFGQRRGYRYAGIGLALFDDQQRQIIPNTLPLHYTPILTSEMTFVILPPAIGQFQKIYVTNSFRSVVSLVYFHEFSFADVTHAKGILPC